MSIVVTRDKIFYAFDPEIKPVARVGLGGKVVFYTVDALGGQITSEEQVVSRIDFSKVNPATGPVYIEGAEPGDALLARITFIETAEKGFVVTAPGAGALPRMAREARTRACYIRGSIVEFLGLRIPAWKMIGVIGVASGEKPSTGMPGRHGGNLDTKYVTEGATVILPVEFEGALFGLGDLHAVMGNGEICVAACEVSGKVEVEFNVVKGAAPPWPVVDYGDSLYILVSRESIEKAVEDAAEVAVEVLKRGLNLDWSDAYMLASLSVDIGVSQLVNPRKTVQVRILKNVLPLSKLLQALSTMKGD